MSAQDGGKPLPSARPAARRTPRGAKGVELPRGWRLSTHRVAGSVSILLETAYGDTATVYIDLHTGERVTELPQGHRATSAVREMVSHVITLLEDSGAVEGQPGTPQFDGDDLSTWTPMQILALRTGARWELPERVGGSASLTRRVNDAIRLWSERT